MTLPIINLTEFARPLGRPFILHPVMPVGDLLLSVFMCQGQMHWHKHVDDDELFWVHEGVITLETERGNLTLHAEEVAVVPKGVAHRSSSVLRSVVMLIRPASMSERANGHRHYYTITGEAPIEKVRLARAGKTFPVPYVPVTLATVQGWALLAYTAEGFGPLETAPAHGALCAVLRGAVGVELDHAPGARLVEGELTLVPGGAAYRVHSAAPSLIVTLARLGESD